MTYLVAIVAGTIAAVLVLAVSFFPFSPWINTGLYGALGAWLAYRRPTGFWRWALVASLPAVLLALVYVRNLGLRKVMEGVGTYWALYVVLLPAAALGGAYVGARIATRTAAKPMRSR